MKKAKKSLGQNFLIDKNIINKIINITQIKDKHILEIGPGRGALTEEILKKKPKSLIIIEKDNDLAVFLKKKYLTNKIIEVYNDDVLKINLEKIVKKDTIVFGNLPYNISSQILIKMIKFKKWPTNYSNLIFMFQKELGEKIIAPFKSLNYGRLSIITSLKLNIINTFIISPNCFKPKPKVKSIIIQFKPKKKFEKCDIIKLESITNLFFSRKRKMINKTINKILNKKQISMLKDLDLTKRPSEIPPKIYFKITSMVT